MPCFNTFEDGQCPAIRVQQASEDCLPHIRVKGGNTCCSDQCSDFLKEYAVDVIKNAQGDTATYVANDRLRIYCDDGKAYTMKERNDAWVANGHSAVGLPEPIGYAITKRDGTVEVIYFEAWAGNNYAIDGSGGANAGLLPHSMYSVPSVITAAATGTDVVTNKGWAVTADGDDFILSEENTGWSGRIPKGINYCNALEDLDDFEERTESLYQICEWYRHRFAIASGITTTEEDGATTTVEILNASGQQAAVGEDMYFWIGGVSTSLLAKYNLNNVHAGAALMTATQQQTIYDAQKAAGINMNDTGVNSTTKPILATGSKGAEAIAVNGEWYIITPYITFPANAARVADAPAVYWAKSKGWSLPSQDAIEMLYFNKVMINTGWRAYFPAVEGITIPALTTGSIWSSARTSANNAWYIGTANGYRNANVTYGRCNAVGASRLL